MTMTWVRGRELATVTKGSDTISYTYGESGLRITKTVNGVVHKYIYDGDLLISEQFGDTLLIYVYDEAGSPIGFKYRTTGYAIGAFDSYVFEKNLQGDIIAIYNTSGTAVATYKYDAWGNVISATGTMASVNPFRYRGYYYDIETGFYYLRSRYYDPAIGRFINADNQLSTGGFNGINLYSYCDNNPVMRIDPTGEAWWHWAIGAAIVVACAVAVVVTAGGVAAGMAAVTVVANGVAAATTASTVAAGAFIGSSTVLGGAVIDAWINSDSVEEFCEQGSWWTVAGVAGGAVLGGLSGYAISNTQEASLIVRGEHTSGTGSPNKNINPNGSYTKLDNNGNLYSYTEYDSYGRQRMRIDFQGRSHAGIIPHIHIFVYPELGGRVEYVFDLDWNLIN